MQTVYPNSLRPDDFKIAGTREEIYLLFGNVQLPMQAGALHVFKLLERIILGPYTAKSIALALAECIRRYESAYGDIAEPTDRGGQDTADSAQVAARSAPLAQEISKKSAMLLELVRGLGVRFGVEHSFKISERTVISNRYLISINKNAIIKPGPKLLVVCGKLGLPKDFLAALTGELPHADFVHFGFEGNENGCVLKVYLEFKNRYRQALSAGDMGSAGKPLYLGYKWDPFNEEKKALTEYRPRPCSSAEEIAGALGDIFKGQKRSGVLKYSRAVLKLALKKTVSGDILLLEVTESQWRRSFDLNVYNAYLKISNLDRFFKSLCRTYSLPAEEFQDLYGRIKGQTLGHMAGGFDRDGREFLTFYYGAEGF